jgi:acetyl-CoA carboxylase carboxyltransferase component
VLAGGARLVQRHHERNKMLARERIDFLLDPLSPTLGLSAPAALA